MGSQKSAKTKDFIKRKLGLQSFRFLKVPEVLIILLAFFLNFFWEVVHTNFYTFKAMPYNTLLNGWFHCTLGDIIITMGVFWFISLINRSRKWFLNMNPFNFAGFIAVGVIYTIVSERANVYHHRAWVYNESMPIIPYIEVGFTPILQWLIVPSIIILFIQHYYCLLETA
jgi:hypothetical protein